MASIQKHSDSEIEFSCWYAQGGGYTLSIVADGKNYHFRAKEARILRMMESALEAMRKARELDVD